MHSSVEVTAAGVAELGWGQGGPDQVLCGAGCERLELPWEGHAQRCAPVTLPRNRMEGKHVTFHFSPPQEAHRELRKDPNAPHLGCTQPFVRGSCYALNFLLFFDLGFCEEP